MCGIVGIVSKSKFGLFGQDVDLFKQLLFADQLRGSDGTGIFFNFMKNTGSTRVIKSPIPSSEFLLHKEIVKGLDSAGKVSSFIVGHNRSATRGTIDGECTHPFKEKHITLIHNGTLLTHKELSDNSKVDSHAICVSIANIGSKNTLEKLNGAFALVWYDAIEGTLNLCRNWERPLYILETKELYIFVSELDMGIWIAGRNKNPILKSFQIEPKKVYKFNVADMSEYTTEDVKYKEYVTPATKYLPFHHNSMDYFDYGDQNKGAGYDLKSYRLGASVKFKTGTLVEGIHPHIDCFILEHPNVPVVSRLPVNYEPISRVKLYGTVNWLKKMQVSCNLVGNILAEVRKGICKYYTVRDVMPEYNIILPQIKTGVVVGETKCDFCDCIFTKNDVIYDVDEYTLCAHCALTMSESNVARQCC